MDAQVQYYQKVTQLLREIHETQQEKIRTVAGVMADSIARDRLVFVVGTGGHSFMTAEEMFNRAGGLACVFPVFDPGIPTMFGARRSTAIERMPGYMKRVLDTYPIEPGDVLVIGNAYGINSATIDSALWAREHRVTSVGITSPAFSRRVPKDHPARHPSGHDLYEVVDHWIDCRMPPDDPVVELEGLRARVSPVSTILNAFVVQSLVAATTQELLRRGVEPPVWTSANIPGGDEANRHLLARYVPRVRYL